MRLGLINASHFLRNSSTFIRMVWMVMLAGAVAVFVGLYVLAHHSKGVCKSNADLTGKTVIITGANSGIGFFTSKDLASRNARVILACRRLQAGQTAVQKIRQQTGNMDVTVKHLDLSSLKSVRQFSEEICKEEKKLNILINNAALANADRTIRTDEGHDLAMTTNYFGPFLLTNLLLDLLKSSSPSRIVHVSSMVHAWGIVDFENLDYIKEYPISRSPYVDSKLCQVLFSRELSCRLRGSGVTSNCLHPGAIGTGIYQSTPLAVRLIVAITGPVFFKTIEEGAQTSVHCAVDESLQNVTGKYFADCKVTKESSKAQDDDLARALWDATVKITGLNSK